MGCGTLTGVIFSRNCAAAVALLAVNLAVAPGVSSAQTAAAQLTLQAPPQTHRHVRLRIVSRNLSRSVSEGVPATAAQAGGQAVPQADLPMAPSATRPPLLLPGGTSVPRETISAMPLTLDQAIALALRSNAEILIRAQQEKYVAGQVLSVETSLFPSITAVAYTQTEEKNLKAMGFNPASIKIKGFNGNIPTIVKVDTTSAQLQLSQTLALPALFLLRAARKAGEASVRATQSARGGVVLNTGALYLKTLADQAQLRNAEALERQDQVVYDHAKASRDAGVGISLDVLRAQVQLQNTQQAKVRAANQIAKDKILLNREMGQPAGQELELLDAVPYAEYAGMSLEDAREIAYRNRKDLLGLQAQLELANQTLKAIKYERLPALGFGGYYGVLGETRGLYHGVFAAQGKLQIPIFQEATFRGQREVAAAQASGLRQQIEALRGQIDADLRASMLDVQTAHDLVTVARSNEALSVQALSDSRERFNAGVDDSLPLTRAQAALEGAQSQVVQAEFQFNYAKLQLARNTGVIESQYRSYLR